MSDLYLRFETRASKPPVFQMTGPLIAAAKARSGLGELYTSLGEDLRDTGWLAQADGLVSSNDLVRDPKFRSVSSPRRHRGCAGSTSSGPG